MYILSTNKGLMSDKDARSQNIGGEVICEVFLIMSRVAKNPISVPSGTEINLNEKTISVSGAKGKSEFAFPDTVSATFFR